MALIIGLKPSDVMWFITSYLLNHSLAKAQPWLTATESVSLFSLSLSLSAPTGFTGAQAPTGALRTSEEDGEATS